MTGSTKGEPSGDDDDMMFSGATVCCRFGRRLRITSMEILIWMWTILVGGGHQYGCNENGGGGMRGGKFDKKDQNDGGTLANDL